MELIKLSFFSLVVLLLCGHTSLAANNPYIYGRWTTPFEEGLNFISLFNSSSGSSYVNYGQTNITLTMMENNHIDGKLLVASIPIINNSCKQPRCWQGKALTSLLLVYRQQPVDSTNIMLSYNITDKGMDISSGLLKVSVRNGGSFISHWTPITIIILNMILIGLIRAAIRWERIPIGKMSHFPILFSMASQTLLVMFLLYAILEEQTPYQLYFLVAATMSLMTLISLAQYAHKLHLLTERLAPILTFLGILYAVPVVSFFWYRLTLIINALWLLPQIQHNVKIGGRVKFHSWHFLIVIFNQLYFLSVVGCQHNIMQMEPNFTKFSVICVVIILQLLVLRTQETEGGRFFCPTFLIFGYHEYHVQVQKTSPIAQENCPICLIELKDEPDAEMRQQVQSEQNNSIYLMKTPCNHFFHAFCLKKCMDNNMMCPIDRTPLPPLD